MTLAFKLLCQCVCHLSQYLFPRSLAVTELLQWSEVAKCTSVDGAYDYDDDDDFVLQSCTQNYDIHYVVNSKIFRFKFGYSKGNLDQRMVMLSSDHTG